MRTLGTPLLAAALLAGVAAGPAAAFAQSAAAPANPAPAEHAGKPRMLPGQYVEGRIAFLKAELAITPAQEAQWQAVAAAMRQNADALDKAIAGAQHGRTDAVERLEMRGQLARLRADNDARLLAAFKPLYASLSTAQRQKADALFASGHGRHHAWHGHA